MGAGRCVHHCHPRGGVDPGRGPISRTTQIPPTADRVGEADCKGKTVYSKEIVVYMTEGRGFPASLYRGVGIFRFLGIL